MKYCGRKDIICCRNRTLYQKYCWQLTAGITLVFQICIQCCTRGLLYRLSTPYSSCYLGKLNFSIAKLPYCIGKLIRLENLSRSFPDCKVRKTAVLWMETFSHDEVVDYLPQLVQALKHETFETSVLAKFLLERALLSPRVAHYLFWLLTHFLPTSRLQVCSIFRSLDITIIS